MTTLLTLIGCLALIGWLYLAFFNGGFWQLTFDDGSPDPQSWPSIDIIVPARNEAGTLSRTLPLLLAQDYPGTWRILLVDDHSADGTGALAHKIADDQNKGERLTVITAPELLIGWSGKVAAMHAGMPQSTAEYILFTDADIAHPADSLRRLAAGAVEKKLDLVSRMVKLNCEDFAERLLIPAFVFFFAMLYPFARVNNPDSSVAAAAGGVMLVRRRALDAIGGLTRIKPALIDDCALAQAIKEHGGVDETPGRIELTLVRDIQSLRTYPHIRDIWHMVARTAYTQLRHSPWLLIGTVIGMGILFLAPVVFPLVGRSRAGEAGLEAWFVMCMLYWPMLRFYDLPLVWTLTLPAAALIYIGATVDSARRYWQGKGGQWKGRNQA